MRFKVEVRVGFLSRVRGWVRVKVRVRALPIRCSGTVSGSGECSFGVGMNPLIESEKEVQGFRVQFSASVL